MSFYYGIPLESLDFCSFPGTFFFWALVNIIDVYFVSSVYEDEWDGIFINSVFQLLPWLLPVFGIVSFQYPGGLPSVVAFIGGASLILAFFFYFKTLFVSNDVAVIQAIWNLSVPLVPFLSWLLLSEKLLPVHYGGIALAFTGAMLFITHEEIRTRNFFWSCQNNGWGSCSFFLKHGSSVESL